MLVPHYPATAHWRATTATAAPGLVVDTVAFHATGSGPAWTPAADRWVYVDSAHDLHPCQWMALLARLASSVPLPRVVVLAGDAAAPGAAVPAIWRCWLRLAADAADHGHDPVNKVVPGGWEHHKK